MLRRFLAAIAIILLATPLVRAGTAVIPTLTGFVRDSGGNAVSGGDLDFFVSATGVKLLTPGDNTDALGFYSVSVLPGVYDVTFAPPAGTRLMGKRFDNLDMTNDVGIQLDVTLNSGLIISGMVTELGTGQPVVAVDIDVDRVGGTRVFTPNDNTDPAGAYAVVVPTGLYRVRFDPPPGSLLRGVQMDSVSVMGDVALNAALPAGLRFNGRVSSSTGALEGVEIDLRDFATGQKVYLSNNTTDAVGDYLVAVPAGVFHLRYIPPLDAPFVAVAIDSVAISADSQRDQLLLSGHRVNVVVTDTTGAPLLGADVDAKNALTQEKLFTPHDKTAANGMTTVVLAADTYDFQFDPPVGTTLDRTTLTGVTITADTTITVTLKEVPRVRASGRVVDAFGTPLVGIEVGAKVAGGGNSVFISTPLTDAFGQFDVLIPIANLDITFTPPVGARLVGRRVSGVAVAVDSAWTDVVLPTGSFLTVMVEDASGAPVSAVDLDVINEATSSQQFVPRDETDTSGRAVVVLENGTYSVVASPRPGSGLGPNTVTGLSLAADTSVTITLAGELGTDAPSFILGDGFPNPFSASITVPFELVAPASVAVRVYNVAGQLVKTLASGMRGVGPDRVHWDGTNSNGSRVSGGVYFIDMETSAGRQTRKAVLIR